MTSSTTNTTALSSYAKGRAHAHATLREARIATNATSGWARRAAYLAHVKLGLVAAAEALAETDADFANGLLSVVRNDKEVARLGWDGYLAALEATANA